MNLEDERCVGSRCVVRQREHEQIDVLHSGRMGVDEEEVVGGQDLAVEDAFVEDAAELAFHVEDFGGGEQLRVIEAEGPRPRTS